MKYLRPEQVSCPDIFIVNLISNKFGLQMGLHIWSNNQAELLNVICFDLHCVQEWEECLITITANRSRTKSYVDTEILSEIQIVCPNGLYLIFAAER